MREELDEVLALWNRSRALDPLTPALLQEKIWGDPDFRAEDCLVVAPDGVLRGLGMACRRSSTGTGYLKLLAVDPEWRRQGLGRQLVQQLESNLRRAGAERVRVAESQPNYLVPGEDVRYTPALCFWEQRGYQKIGETYNLKCWLERENFDTRQEESGLPKVEFRRAHPADWPTLEDFLAQHFPGWQYEVAQMLKNQPVSLHLAIQGDLLGFAGFDGNNLGSGWFGPMGTQPAARGLGLGRILLRRCLADLKAQGHPTCWIPWVGPYGFYCRHSPSCIERVFWRLEKPLLP